MMCCRQSDPDGDRVAWGREAMLSYYRDGGRERMEDKERVLRMFYGKTKAEKAAAKKELEKQNLDKKDEKFVAPEGRFEK